MRENNGFMNTTIRLPVEQHYEFKLYCAKNRMSMHKAIIKAIDLLMIQEKKKDKHDTKKDY